MRACERCSSLTRPAHHAHLLFFCSTPAAPADLLHECYRGSGQARCRCNDAPTRPGGCKGKSARRDSEQAETVVLSPTFPYHGLSPPSLAASGQSHIFSLPLRQWDTGSAGHRGDTQGTVQTAAHLARVAFDGALRTLLRFPGLDEVSEYGSVFT